jgi:hypothetical protein
MNGGVDQKNSSDIITYGLQRSSGKFRSLPEYHFVKGISQKKSRAFHNVGCYDLEVNIPKNFKTLVITCSMAGDKRTFHKNIGRVLEHQREEFLPFASPKSLRQLSDLQSLVQEAQISLPKRKTKYDLDWNDALFEVDDQTLHAAALEQLKILNKEITELRNRVKSSLKRMDEMEKKNV